MSEPVSLEECIRIKNVAEGRRDLSKKRISEAFDRTTTGIEPHINGTCDHSDQVPELVCETIRELYNSYGLDPHEIGAYFNFSKSTIRRHATDNCSH